MRRLCWEQTDLPTLTSAIRLFSRMDLLEWLFSTQTEADFISMAKAQHQDIADDISCIRIWTTGGPRATMSEEPDIMDEETAADRAERCPEPIQPQRHPRPVRLRTAPEAPGPAIPPPPMGDAPARRHSKSGAAKQSAAGRRARKNLLYRLMAAAAVLAVFGMTVAFIATTLVRLHRLETATRTQAEIISNLDLSGAQRDRKWSSLRGFSYHHAHALIAGPRIQSSGCGDPLSRPRAARASCKKQICRLVLIQSAYHMCGTNRMDCQTSKQKGVIP